MFQKKIILAIFHIVFLNGLIGCGSKTIQYKELPTTANVSPDKVRIILKRSSNFYGGACDIEVTNGKSSIGSLASGDTLIWEESAKSFMIIASQNCGSLGAPPAKFGVQILSVKSGEIYHFNLYHAADKISPLPNQTGLVVNSIEGYQNTNSTSESLELALIAMQAIAAAKGKPYSTPYMGNNTTYNPGIKNNNTSGNCFLQQQQCGQHCTTDACVAKCYQQALECNNQTISGTSNSTGNYSSDTGNSDNCKPVPKFCKKASDRGIEKINKLPNTTGLSDSASTGYCGALIGVRVNKFCADEYRDEGRDKCAQLVDQQVIEYQRALPQYESVVDTASITRIRSACHWEK